jgi:hypothetical protein
VSAAQPQRESNSAAVDALLSLQHPTRPTRQLPLQLRRLLPDPTARLEDWQRFTHEDLVAMTSAQRRSENFRIRVALALCPHPEDDVPDWVLERLARLEVA